MQALVVNGVLYAVGCYSKTIKRYDPVSDEWTMICSFPKNKEDPLKCTSFYDKVMILHRRGHFEKYDPVTNKSKETRINRLTNAIDIFSYSGELLVSKFVYNENF